MIWDLIRKLARAAGWLAAAGFGWALSLAWADHSHWSRSMAWTVSILIGVCCILVPLWLRLERERARG